MTSKTSKWKDIRRTSGPDSEARIAAMRQAMVDAMALADLRQVRGFSQAEVAEVLDLSQSRVSRIEREEDLYLSTLRRYVAALGGQLELVAVFEDETLPIGLPTVA